MLEETMRNYLKLILCLVLALMVSQPAWAMDPYPISYVKVQKHKDLFDDPRSLYTSTDDWKTFIPEEAQKKIYFDVDEMKKVWSETVGFKAPDVVGKSFPEIKPGKYTLADKTQLPFDKLMPKYYYDRWNKPGEGGPNHAGNFIEIEVVPTRQYYWALPVGKATLANTGQTKQDDQGYILYDTYKGGYPFPQPSGKHKAMQIVYNYDLRYQDGDDATNVEFGYGVDKNWKHDNTTVAETSMVRTAARVWQEPHGFLDKRAERMKEQRIWTYTLAEPRDFYGNVYSLTWYMDNKKPMSLLAYVNILRRIRKLSSSDKQDQAVGQDICFDDSWMWSQSISPTNYPYEYKLLEERELLVPACNQKGDAYVDTKNKFQAHNYRFERRPCYVVECKQLDENYIYSKKIIWADKETLLWHNIECYDQKGRLYRNQAVTWGHVKSIGIFNMFNMYNADFIDVHSSYLASWSYPALWLGRRDVSLRSLMKAK
jgi:Protein of unknown function (DUF1329)